MSRNKTSNGGMTNYRWTMCLMLFFATTINYLDRQVLSLTWKDFIAPEFHWTDANYGDIAAFFSIAYAISTLFAGRFVDRIGTKKGFMWAIGIWSVGACLHALCGVITQRFVGLDGAAALEAVKSGSALAFTIASISTYAFLAARLILAVGEAGNFPGAIKVVAEYFPKRDRAFATAVFNTGASVGALVAPLTIPLIARYFKNIGFGGGWEMAFLLIGGLGFIWMGFWVFVYDRPTESSKVNSAELEYITQDDNIAEIEQEQQEEENSTKLSFLQCLTFRQTWAFIVGKFMSDGVWWFFLFWTPAYISDVYGYTSDSGTGMAAIFLIYLISMLSIVGGKLPSIIMNRTNKDPYAARMRAMLIFAFFPILALLAQPLGSVSVWCPVIIIGIVGAAHCSWAANIYSTVSDMFPKSAVGTIIGIGTTAGGLSSFLINKGSGMLFTYADETSLKFMGFEGKPAGYFIVFIICAVSYILGWVIMKMLVPKYSPITIK